VGFAFVWEATFVKEVTSPVQLYSQREDLHENGRFAMAKKSEKQASAAASVTAEMVEALRPVGEITSKSMFGGFGIFESGTMFALVNAKAQLHFRADATMRTRYENAGSTQHKPMPYFEVPADVLDDDSLLVEWAEEATRVAHAAKKKK